MSVLNKWCTLYLFHLAHNFYFSCCTDLWCVLPNNTGVTIVSRNCKHGLCQGMFEHLERQGQCKSSGTRSSVVAGLNLFRVFLPVLLPSVEVLRKGWAVASNRVELSQCRERTSHGRRARDSQCNSWRFTCWRLDSDYCVLDARKYSLPVLLMSAK